MTAMAATLRDVAEVAQVSIRTVSNVVSGYQHVSERTRSRVLEAIDQLDYRANPVARTLRTGRSGLVALVVPEIDVPYFSELARDVIAAAAEFGYRVMIDQTGHDHGRERQLLLGKDRNMLVDGVLFSPLVTKAELLDMHDSTRMPLVLLGEHDFDGRYDHVTIDNVKAAHDAVAHLIECGRNRIAAIGAQPQEEYATPQQRTIGYEQALDAAGLAFRQEYPAARYSRSDGYAAAEELLARSPRPDAIFCFSDLLAIGAVRAVFDAGLSVPEDIAVIGIDDNDEGRYAHPSLSTVSLDTGFIAKEAVRLLSGRIHRPESSAQQVVSAHRVIARESTLGTACSPLHR